MESNQFEVLAQCYDILNGADYDKYAEFLQNIFKKHGTGGKLLLDLACGTGELAVKLAKMGYDMTAVDSSQEMLSLAQQKSHENNCEILFLCQDMRNFELYGTVDAIICTLDGVNYLTKNDDLRTCFASVYNYLEYDGLFIFDVNTPWKLENIFGSRDFFLHSGNQNSSEKTDVYLGWKSNFNKKSGLCNFDLTIFSADRQGKYIKAEENQVEKSWEMNTLVSLIDECGLKIVDIYSNLNLEKVKNDSEKWFFVAKKPFKK